jgi:hypothetical protein
LFRIIEITINSNEKAKIALKLMMCVGGTSFCAVM